MQYPRLVIAVALLVSARPVVAEPPAAAGFADNVEWSANLRLRTVFAPRSLIEVFVDRAPGGVQNYGIGLEAVRRHGTLELQLGVEYDSLAMPQGVWIDSAANIAPGGMRQHSVDYVLDPDHSGHRFGWVTFEATFVKNVPITKMVAFRYGGGTGIGVFTGSLLRYNVFCGDGVTLAQPEPYCLPPIEPYNGDGRFTTDKGQQPPALSYKLPPVFPVLNAILGVQIRPAPRVVINVEGGLRTLPFFGVSAGYVFY